MTTTPTPLQLAERESDRLRQVVADLEAERVALVREIPVQAADAGRRAVDAFLAGEPVRSDATVLTAAHQRMETLGAAVEDARRGYQEAQRAVQRAQPAEWRAQAAALRQEAAESQRKLDRLLVALHDLEGVWYAPVREQAPYGGALASVGRTQVLREQADALDLQALRLEHELVE